MKVLTDLDLALEYPFEYRGSNILYFDHKGHRTDLLHHRFTLAWKDTSEGWRYVVWN